MVHRFKSGSRNQIEKCYASAMGERSNTLWRVHGTFLYYYSRFFEVCQGLFRIFLSRDLFRLIFCPLGNYEVGIGFTTSANPSAQPFCLSPSARRRQGSLKEVAILRCLSSSPKISCRRGAESVKDNYKGQTHRMLHEKVARNADVRV
jgi:hypothetical protein